MDWRRIVFSGHAVQRMFERGISVDDVQSGLREGEQINEYPDDEPFPSFVMLEIQKARPIHVVAAWDSDTQTVHVITAYEPDKNSWEPGFRSRKIS